MIYWEHYNKKIKERILKPRNWGVLQEKPPLHLIKIALPDLYFYLLIDPEDGCIADAKFQLMGPTYLVAAFDLLSEKILQKPTHEIKRVPQTILSEFPHIPQEKFQLLYDALNELPLLKATPISSSTTSENAPTVDWQALSHKEKLELIEHVIATEIRPYIEMDEGGIEVVELIDKELIISYSGACTSCFSSIGATLSSIQSILQSKVMSELTVRPQL